MKISISGQRARGTPTQRIPRIGSVWRRKSTSAIYQTARRNPSTSTAGRSRKLRRNSWPRLLRISLLRYRFISLDFSTITIRKTAILNPLCGDLPTEYKTYLERETRILKNLQNRELWKIEENCSFRRKSKCSTL